MNINNLQYKFNVFSEIVFYILMTKKTQNRVKKAIEIS